MHTIPPTLTPPTLATRTSLQVIDTTARHRREVLERAGLVLPDAGDLGLPRSLTASVEEAVEGDEPGVGGADVPAATPAADPGADPGAEPKGRKARWPFRRL
jgi:hypothetical protein